MDHVETLKAELSAIRKIENVLAKLPVEVRARVLKYIADRATALAPSDG